MFARLDFLSHPRSLAWLAFFGAIAGLWWAVYAMVAGQVGWLCGPDGVLLLPYLGLPQLFAMWALMMLAMMLPTLVPVLSAYDALPLGGSKGWAGIVLGYSGVWAVGSMGFALAQLALMRLGLLDLGGASASQWLSVLLLLIAGGWQFTRGKEICLDACLSPMSYFLGRFRPGLGGGLVMGVDLGITCVGCCWAIMALGFVGGTMSLLWMGLATAFMILEKLPDFGMYLRKPAGAALIALAAGMSINALV